MLRRCFGGFWRCWIFELFLGGRNLNVTGVAILLLLITTVFATSIVLWVMSTPFVLSSTGNGVSNVTGVLMQVSLSACLLLCSWLFCDSLVLGVGVVNVMVVFWTFFLLPSSWWILSLGGGGSGTVSTGDFILVELALKLHIEFF